MNERIKELAEQAHCYACEYAQQPDYNPHNPYNQAMYKQRYDSKFAELIVRDCMDLALAEQKRYANITHRNMNECAVALGNFSLLIKDHFEDEE